MVTRKMHKRYYLLLLLLHFSFFSYSQKNYEFLWNLSGIKYSENKIGRSSFLPTYDQFVKDTSVHKKYKNKEVLYFSKVKRDSSIGDSKDNYKYNAGDFIAEYSHIAYPRPGFNREICTHESYSYSNINSTISVVGQMIDGDFFTEVFYFNIKTKLLDSVIYRSNSVIKIILLYNNSGFLLSTDIIDGELVQRIEKHIYDDSNYNRRYFHFHVDDIKIIDKKHIKALDKIVSNIKRDINWRGVHYCKNIFPSYTSETWFLNDSVFDFWYTYESRGKTVREEIFYNNLLDRRSLKFNKSAILLGFNSQTFYGISLSNKKGVYQEGSQKGRITGYTHMLNRKRSRLLERHYNSDGHTPYIRYIVEYKYY